MNGIEIWTGFDAGKISEELTRGKHYFPNMNAVRIWLSWEAFSVDGDLFSRNLESFLRIVESQHCTAIPILFNRWRGYPDFGGIYIDDFLPGSLEGDRRQKIRNAYIDAIVGRHANDPRVCAWDLCNEPFFYKRALDDVPEIDSNVAAAELIWLRSVYSRVKSQNPTQPLTVAAFLNYPLSKMNEFSDILTIHPYWMNGAVTLDEFTRRVDEHLAYANSVGKPLLATECCLGKEDDLERVQIIAGTLEVLKSRNIGWLPHLLHHSLVSDAHRASFGSSSGLYMAFIEADGSLRKGHEIYNKF